MESFSGSKGYLGWNGDPELFFVAAEAAIEAGPFEPSRQVIMLNWDDREGTYNSIEEARTRLRHGPMPTRAEVDVRQLAEDTTPARVHIQVLGGVVTIIGAGSEWGKASRAYQAAVVAYERASPAPVSAPAVVESQSAVTPPDARSGLRTWLNENQGFLTAVGIAVTVIVAVATLLLV